MDTKVSILILESDIGAGNKKMHTRRIQALYVLEGNPFFFHNKNQEKVKKKNMKLDWISDKSSAFPQKGISFQVWRWKLRRG